MFLSVFVVVVLFLTALVPAKAEEANPQVFLEGKPVIGLPFLNKAKGDWLIPAAPVARALGSQLEVAPDGSTIKVVRAQDSSSAVYSPRTGELLVNGIPSGTYMPEVPLSMVPEFLALPPDLMAVLFGVTIQSGPQRIEINRAEIHSAVFVQPRESYKDFGFDYIQTEAGESSLKLNPQVQGKATHYSVVENMFVGSGGHWGPLTFNGGTRLQGGTGYNFLTFNSATLQIRNLRTGLKLYGGDNPLSGFQSKQLNGYPGRGLLYYVPRGRLTFAGFNGLGFTQGIPVGGGTVRLSYERYLSVNEATWRPSPRFTTSVASVLFYDRHPFVARTQQHGYYFQTSSIYQTDHTNILGELFVGEGRRTNLQEGGAYLFDLIAKRDINKRLSTFAEYDRVSPHFSHPQIGNAFVDRSDAIVGTAFKACRWLQSSCNYSLNQSQLEARRPSRIQVINASWRISPFEHGPSFNILGSQTFFRPLVPREPSDAVTLAHSFAINVLNQPITQVLQQGLGGSQKSKSTLGTITMDHKIHDFQINGSATTSVISTEGQMKPTLSNSVSMSIGRRCGRLGDFQFMSQIGIFTTRISTHTFDIKAIYTTPPLFGRTALLFGPGFSRAGDFQRFTFIASLTTNVPYLGAYSMNVTRQVAQTTSAGKYLNTIFLNKSRGRQTLDTAAQGKVPPFGSVNGLVLEDAEYPVKEASKAPRLARIRITLDGQEGIYRETGPDGKWSFNDIPAGRHRVAVSVFSTPAAYTIVSPTTFYVQVWPGQTTSVNFALAKMGQLSGSLKPDAGLEVPRGRLGSVRIHLKERDIDTLTDVNGSYSLTDVAPGTYTVRVDEGYLPEDLTAEPSEKTIKIGSGETLKDVDFSVKKKERSTTKRKM